MKILSFQTGPILGATDASSARIFGRGEPQLIGGLPRRAHAVIRTCDDDGSHGTKPRYFKLNANFDMSAVCVLEGLTEETLYSYQAGYFFSDVDSDKIDVDDVLDWSGIPPVQFRTGSTSSFGLRTVAVGSCRYLLKLLGGSVFDDRGDKAFRSMLEFHQTKQRNLDALILCGDQIYADDLNFAFPDATVEEYLARYRLVFSQEHIKRLMSRVPTYMTLDDHEIEDNWPAGANPADLKTKFPAAMHAYQIYQLSHSPLHPVVDGKIGSPPHRRLWYTHRDGCCDFFMVDSRTERKLGPDAGSEMVSAEQLEALLAWLGDGSGRVKVLVTSVPFWEATGQDKWDGFLRQRDAILEHIRINQVRRVLILSGDLHASMSSELHIPWDPAFKVVSVVSSALFWPYPHPLRHDFLLSGAIRSSTATPYRVENAGTVVATDNYTILRIQLDRVGVDVYGRKGTLLSTKDHHF